MKKSLIALAVAGALTAPMVAQADATLYGSFRVGIQSVDDADLDMVDESSRIGIKGDVDLGLEGTKGLFHWEANVNSSDSTTDILKERLSYIGMTGDWGTVLAGRQYHPHYLLIGGATNVFNTATGSTGEWAFLGNEADGAVDHKRVDNTLAYASPVMNGFQVIAGAVIAGTGNDAADDVDGYNVAAKYAANGLTVALSYAEVDAIDRDLIGLSASYKIDALTLSARYEDKELANVDSDSYGIAAVYDLGDGLSIKGRFSSRDHDTKGEGDQWAAEVEQKLGKGRIYANYFAQDNDAEANYSVKDTLTVGYRVDF